MNYKIITETADFVAIDKPSGLLTIPDRHDDKQPSLLSMLRARYGTIFTVHRLDKMTSGVILFARNAEAHRHLSLLFEGRNVEKHYIGIVHGRMEKEIGTIDEPIAVNPNKKGEMIATKKGKPSVTEFKVMESNRMFSVVNFHPLTGRTHQIRVHANYIHHPLLCDPVYGDGNPVFLSSFKKKYHLAKSEEQEHPLFNRLALHAHSLDFKMADGKIVHLESPVPKDMNALIRQMGKHLA